MSFRIAGTYLEACNCEAICPCRMIDGVPGGRSTHGVCFGALSWRVDEGEAAGVDLSGSGAVMTYSYDDDEPGSPWTLVLHVDGPGECRGTDGSDRVRRRRGSGGDAVRLRATTPFETDSTVSCIVPGHDRPGTELVNDEVIVKDPPLEFELHGTCAFTRDFEYSS